MPDPQKPLDRLKPFMRINNEEFIPSGAPDGLGVACGCHTPDDIPNIEADFKKFLDDHPESLGNLNEVLNEAHEIAHQVVQVADKITDAMKVLIALAAAIGALGTPVGSLIATLAAIATAVASSTTSSTGLIRRLRNSLWEWVPTWQGAQPVASPNGSRSSKGLPVSRSPGIRSRKLRALLHVATATRSRRHSFNGTTG